MQDQFQRARELIKAKRYDAAREILQGIDHPQAKAWLKKLDEIAPQQKKSGGRPLLVSLLLLVLMIVIGVAAFAGGRATAPEEATVDVALISTQAIETFFAQTPACGESCMLATSISATNFAIETEVAKTATAAAETLRAPSPTPDLNRPGARDNPLPVGEVVGDIRLLDLHFPSALVIYDDDPFNDLPVRPRQGLEFASLHIELLCPTDVVVCETIPFIDLVLNDGRIVESGDLYSPSTDFFEEIVGGASTTGWNHYEVPEGVIIQSAKISVGGEQIFLALPPVVDGYTIEQPWEPRSDGGEIRQAPGLMRDLLDGGIDVFHAFYVRDSSGITLVVLALTDEVIYFDEVEVVQDDAVINAMAGVSVFWEEYNSSVDTFELRAYNSSLRETIATVFIDGDTMAAFARGDIGGEEVGRAMDIVIAD